MNEIVTGVISALIAIILTLVGILKLYLPKLKSKNNPGTHEELIEMRKSLIEIGKLLSNHCQMAERDHSDVMSGLSRIEQKLK